MSTAAGPHGVTPAARALVRVATATLPSGALRERYRLEHLGELHALPATDQMTYAVGAMASSWALRRAVLEESDMTQSPAPASKPILCRLNLHHRWHAEHNPMGEAYRRCLRCGKDDPGPPPRGAPKRPMPFA